MGCILFIVKMLADLDLFLKEEAKNLARYGGGKVTDRG